MTPDQIPQLLAEIALADPRVRRDDPFERRAQIKLWAAALAEVPYDDALDAAGRHYGRSQWPVTPAEIAEIWRTATRDRLERHTDPDLNADPDDPQAWRAELLDTRQAVANGQLPPAGYTAAQGHRPAVAALPPGATQPPGYMPRTVAEELARLFPRRAEREAAREAARANGTADALTVRCDWCASRAGQPCQRGGRPGPSRTLAVPHPSRVEAAAALAAREAS